MVLCDTNIFIHAFNGNAKTIPDAIIGATAVIHQLELFTYHLKDFRFIPNIKLYPFNEPE